MKYKCPKCKNVKKPPKLMETIPATMHIPERRKIVCGNCGQVFYAIV